MVVWCTQNLRRDGICFMWHQPCQCCKYSTSVDSQKRAIKKLFTHVESHASAVSLLESRQYHIFKKKQSTNIHTDSIWVDMQSAVKSYSHSFRVTYDNSPVSLSRAENSAIKKAINVNNRDRERKREREMSPDKEPPKLEQATCKKQPICQPSPSTQSILCTE